MSYVLYTHLARARAGSPWPHAWDRHWASTSLQISRHVLCMDACSHAAMNYVYTIHTHARVHATIPGRETTLSSLLLPIATSEHRQHPSRDHTGTQQHARKPCNPQKTKQHQGKKAHIPQCAPSDTSDTKLELPPRSRRCALALLSTSRNLPASLHGASGRPSPSQSTWFHLTGSPLPSLHHSPRGSALFSPSLALSSKSPVPASPHPSSPPR